jgi:pseudaminic acid cytidylyltransferase
MRETEMAETRRIAIVPARGGSKRIPSKNIREFCGRPMISYILDTAAASGLFDVIHVSTDSDQVSSVVDELGFTVDFKRPVELADDVTPILPVLRYVVEEYQRRGKQFDVVCLLYACAPLIDSQDLQSAAKMFERIGGKNVVLGVTAYPVPVEWAYMREEGGHLVPVEPGAFQIRSQDLVTKFYDAGAYAFFPVERITSNRTHSDDDFYGHVLPRYKSVDIDSPDDWMMAEILYRGRNWISE